MITVIMDKQVFFYLITEHLRCLWDACAAS